MSAESAEKPPPEEPSSTTASSGVSTIPSSEENDPAQMAAGTLPLAIEVKAIEDWMVEGTRHRKRNPPYSAGVSSHGTRPLAASPSSGKTTKVQASTVVWSRQWRTPSSASRVESLAP